MSEKQLNVLIPEELRNYVSQRAEREKCGMNKVIAELIRQDMAQRNGDIGERNNLAVIREIVAVEIHQAHAQLRRDLREDRAQEADSHREWLHKQMDRLAGLMIISVRNGGIARRLVYTVLSKAYGPSFAKLAYDDAREKAHQELLPKKAISEHGLIEDDGQTL